MKGIVITSHGPMAQGILETSKLFFGEQPQLKACCLMAEDNPDDARELLINRICNYQALKQNNVILVFDAYKVKGGRRSIEKHHGITVVYTEEAETADSYIEKATHELCKNYRVKVATSDRLEQIIIFGHGAYRISASEFLHEVKEAEEEMREIISLNNKNNL